MKSIICLCFAFLFVSVACGQTSQMDSTVYLEELTVTSTKFPEMRSKIAQQVRVITPAQIKLLNMQTTADLVTQSGVVGMQKSQQGGGSPQLRGFEASRVLLMIDGVRMNNMIYRAGHLQNIITVDNNSFDQAEILLGPSSTVYGSDALGGVVHFKTKDPILAPDKNFLAGGNAFYRLGTVNNEQTLHFDLNLGGKRFGSFTSLTMGRFGDLRMGERINPSYGKEFGLRHHYVERSSDNSGDLLVTNDDPYIQKFSGYHQYDLVQKFLLRQSENINHTWNIQYSTSSNIPRYDRLTDPEGAGLRSAQWFYGPQERLMLAYQVHVKELGTFADQLRTTLSYQSIEESRHDRRFNRPNLRNQVENVDVYAVTVDFQKQIGASNLQYGFDSQFNFLKSTAFNENLSNGEITAVGTRYPDGDNRMHFLALYLTHTLDITETLTLNDGLRIGYSKLYSKFSDKSFFPFPFDEVDQKNTYASGNLGIAFRPTPWWKLSLIASTGYRVPNVDDLGKVFDTSAGTALIVPNPDVKPEKTFNVDIGIARYFTNKVRIEATAYYTRFFDAIVMDPFAFNGQPTIDYEGVPTPVLANQNKGRAKILGLSMLLHAEIISGFSADASYNYAYGRITSGETESPLDHIPPAFGRVNLQYVRGKFVGSAFVNFNGWKKLEDYRLNSEDNEVYATERGMPSWYTVNFRAGYSFNDYVTLQIGIDNLFDLQYRTFSSGINAPGRNLFATFRLTF